ncbi:MAG: cytochrome c [Verrucomicrobiota bacterium]
MALRGTPLLLSLALLWIGLPNRSFGEETPHLTFSNLPQGTAQRPLVFRSYFPNPGLSREVLSHHGQGNPTPRYSAKTGLLDPKAVDLPIDGIPAAIGVSAGPGLSYVWDTTECRLLYSWANGFLDMESYWGPPERGNRKKNDYIPRLVGLLFYRAEGSHPLRINQEVMSHPPRYLGQTRTKTGHPSFSFAFDEDRTVTTKATEGPSPQTIVIRYQSSQADDLLSFHPSANTAFEVLLQQEGILEVLIRPNAADQFHGFQREVITLTEASSEAGQKLYEQFGCAACHSIDGSRNHGPTFQGLADSTRDFPQGNIVADAAYLRESIIQPNAKQVPDYPAGMMPAYPLDEKQVDSLVLFIQSLDPQDL